MIQSISLQELGPGVVVYGDGKDGARDATFRGKVNYPNKSSQWDGYIIIQVKYRQKQFDEPSKAGDWALSQLETDLKKFGSTPETRPAPDYYILVTNVDLTPVPSVGTEALLRAKLAEHAARLSLKGYDVWDGNKVRRLLDAHRDIAVAYGGYITAGDVLAKMQSYLEGLHPNFENVMSDYLQSELEGPDQYARLSEAGSAAERKTHLADVFVDLPVADAKISDPPDDEEEEEDEEAEEERESPKGFLRLVLTCGAIPQDRESVVQRQSLNTDDAGDPTPDTSHIVLIGGPGQGKTTLGQFICQLHRAAILKDRPKGRLSSESAQALSYITKRCENEGGGLPTARRFPVRIELKAFADDLAKEKCSTLLDYIAQRIDKRAGQRVDRNDLERWLSKYPWLVMLDGLDEVPASGNRSEVLESIKQFSTQCATRSSDILVIATSRPQGYSEEFSPGLTSTTTGRLYRPNGPCITQSG